MIKGIMDELRHRGVLHPGEVGLHSVCDETTEGGISGPARGYSGKYRDDMSGQVLRDDLVKEARRKELEYFAAKGVWRKRPKEEAKKRTGRQPISVRGVYVNKGDDIHPRHRSRLVARRLKGG